MSAKLKIQSGGLIAVQGHITNVYNELEELNNSHDLTRIRHMFLYSHLGQKEKFVACVYNINEHKKLVTRNLTALSESVDELELAVNKAKQVIEVEATLDKDIYKIYRKYHG